MKIKKIVSMSYNEHGIFLHPQNMQEFENIQKKFTDAYENRDLDIMLVAAGQLIPDKFEVEEIKK